MPHPDQWMADFQHRTRSEISNESREDANRVLERASKSPQALSNLVKDVQALIKDGNSLDTRLFDIQRLVEKAHLRSRGNAATIRDAYVDLLWKSRSIAGSAKGAADDFRGDMIELLLMDDVPAEDKIQELKSWSLVTQGKGRDAAKQPEQFNKLTNTLLDYAKHVERELSDRQIKGKAALGNYHLEMQEINHKIDALTVGVVQPIVHYLKLAGGAFVSMLNGSPSTALHALLAAVRNGVPELASFGPDLEKTNAERDALYQQKEVLKTKIAQVEGRQLVLGDASSVPSSLRDIADSIKNFASRMTAFTDSFSQLEGEQQKIQEFLRKGTLTTDPVFVSSLDLLKGLLNMSSMANDMYARAPLSS